MLYLLTVIFCVSILLSTTVCKAEQVLAIDDNISLALERLAPLNQNVDLDGIVFAGQKSFLNSFFINAEFSFLEEDVNKSQFTLSQQQILVGYRYPMLINLELQLSFGGIREELEHSSDHFNNKASDTASLIKFAGFYQLNFKHSVGMALHYYDLYDIDRYYLTLLYQYKFTHQWQFSSHVELGYNQKLEHDINGYQLRLKYTF